MPPYQPRNAFRRATFLYSRFLDVLVVLTVAILIIPVSLQIFARFTELLPRYIWTEEAARFLLVWMVMIGAMIGVREGSHFVVDLFPSLTGRKKAALDLISGLFMLIFGFIFLWYGIEFTEFALYRISELAEWPLWLIHMAWPIAGFSWLLFTGEHMWDSLQVLRGRG
ncbi:TRAP transporter small permease [Sediminicoccus sp. KRV36]|uniref:TRAP transporter small permease n=1 Tax=Sediminicoccus sp. KRV36 TaxID=3133721 RepID=UPI00200D66EE|nr:TRAP transporter small permease [Sediminicoccus rosea]UPY36915.1 TRAP transporter small permease [Sediminicoccus rosea]